MSVALITGGGSGIGQALAWGLAEENHQVIIIGRRETKLEATAQRYPEQISYLPADVGTEAGRAEIIAALPPHLKIDFLVHSAGIAEPLKTLPDISLSDWRSIQAVNVEAPLFLSQALLPKLREGARILNISSGLAHEPLLGAMAYCSCKAALHMLYLCLKNELAPYNITVGSMMPGIVDTEMQAHLRSKDEADLPTVAMFRNFPQNGALISPQAVAEGIMYMLLGMNEEQFSRKDWDIAELI